MHDRPQVSGGIDKKQPRRDNLLRPRWPDEFVIEPVQLAKYGIVSLETGALAHKAVKVTKYLRDKPIIFYSIFGIFYSMNSHLNMNSLSSRLLKSL